MKYKILILILIFILLMGITISAEEKQIYEFDEALNIVIKNSLDLKAKDKALSKAYDTFERLDKASPMSITFKNSNFKRFITSQVEPFVKAEEAYRKYRQAILERDNFKTTIGLNLRSAVIAVENAEKALKESSANKKAWENEIKSLKLKMDKNFITEKEYENKKSEFEKKIKEAAKYETALDDAYYNLNLILVRENNNDIEINIVMDMISLDDLDLKQIKKELIAKDLSLTQKKDNRYMQKLYYDLVDEEISNYKIERLAETVREYVLETYEEAKINYETANLEYEKALASFDRNFEEMIQNIKDTIEQAEELEKELSVGQQNAEFIKRKYEAKLITKAEYDNKMNELNTLKDKLDTLQKELNLKFAKLLS